MATGELICPACSREHDAGERFCEQCGMPLVYSQRAEEQPSARRQRARKVKPQYSEGGLVKIASAPNQAQAEFLSNLLLEEGIPSLIRRSAAFDVPEALVGGSRDLLVPLSGAEAAREALTFQPPDGPANDGPA
jgi:hypothetical protein